MASWQTPKTDWISTDYYNYDDLDRVEENTEYLDDEFTTLGYTVSTTTYTYPRSRTSFNHYYDDMNRIENNILAIKDGTWEPLTWTTPVTSWASVSQAFGFGDANRLEQNLYYLKEMLDNIKLAFLYCGDSQGAICGKQNTQL